MGDLSLIMPAIHPYCGGASGTSHGMDYQISDPDKACVKSAKMQLALLTKLLEKGAVKAKEIIKNNKSMFASKEEYLNYVDKINKSGDRINYREDGNVEIILN